MYEPLFKDVHSCVLLNPKYDVLYISEIFNIPFLMETIVQQECPKGYFNINHTRRDCATRVWKEKEKNWHELDEKEKSEAGRIRALSHMEGCKYISSFQENSLYFEDFVDFTIDRKMNLLLVVPPHSKYYIDNITESCKAAFYKVIDGKMCHFLDFSNDSRFNEEDFNDADHLNDTGAIKMTRMISDYLKKECNKI